MMRLYLRLDNPAVHTDAGPALEHVSWVMLDAAGELHSRGSGSPRALAELAGSPALADPDRVVLVIPAEFALSAVLEVPGTRMGQVRKALPFVLEEYLAADLDAMHIATGPIARGQPIAVVAIERRLLADWLAAVRALGFEPGAAVLDVGMLATDARDRIVVLFDDDRALMAAPNGALATEAVNVKTMLAAAVADVEGQCDIELVNGDLTALEQAELQQSTTAALAFEVSDSTVPPLQYLARKFNPSSPYINLLSGEFAVERPKSAAWQRLRTVALLAGVWVGVALLGMAARGLWADHRADVLNAEAEALYRSYFPSDRRVTNIYRQTAQHLGADAGGEGFFTLLGELTRAVARTSGAEVRSLAFNAERSELSAELAVLGFDRLDGVKSTLAEGGYDVEISSAEQQGNQVFARLRMRGAR